MARRRRSANRKSVSRRKRARISRRSGCLLISIISLLSAAVYSLFKYLFIAIFKGLQYMVLFIVKLLSLVWAGFRRMGSGLLGMGRGSALRLDRVRNGLEFEALVANMLKRNGFYQVGQTKKTGDQGVDIVASKDGVKYAIQCKYYASPVGNKAVQEVTAGKIHYGCDCAVVVTNAGFTQSAVELAASTGTLLWDRRALANMLR